MRKGGGLFFQPLSIEFLFTDILLENIEPAAQRTAWPVLVLERRENEKSREKPG